MSSLGNPSNDYQTTLDGISVGIALPPTYTASEWAEAKRVLPDEAASPGPWRTDRAPYTREPMDTISDQEVESTVLMWAAQTGKTEVLLNGVGYFIEADPAAMMYVLPKIQDAQEWSKERLQPMLDDSPSLRGRVSPKKSRDSDNTILHKVFPGGNATLAGANSPSTLASRPKRAVFFDEIDKYAASAKGAGDPIRLAKSRTTTFWNKKFVKASTPLIKHISRIEAEYESSDKRKFWVPCPSCGEHQVLMWAHVEWEKDRPETACYVCQECGEAWTDGQRYQAVSKGEWRAEAPFRGKAGFWLNALNSMFVRLKDLVAQFLEAQDKPELLQVFVNEVLAETWEETGETVDDDDLLERRENYGPELPAGVAVLTAGVDTHDDRLELEVVGWGRDEESWSIDYRVFYGDPAFQDVWDSLDEYLKETWLHASGQKLPIKAACVDTGGHRTQDVYDFCAARWNRKIWAIRGQPGEKLLIWPGKPSKGQGRRKKVPLFNIGVDAAKKTLYSRLKKATKDGPGYCHFPLTWYGPSGHNERQCDQEYFQQLTAEECKIKLERGKAKKYWELPNGKRNEALDNRVYAHAALKSVLSQGFNLNRVADQMKEAASQPAAPTKSKTRVRRWGRNQAAATDPYLN